MTNAVLLYNPAAGRFSLSEKRLKALLENLYRCGIRGEVVSTVSSTDPSLWLNLKDKDLLIVYGGDGTLHQVIGEAVRWKVPVALLPAGTANVLARELNIPRDPERALRVVVGRKIRKIHLGQANGNYFHLMAGIGFDADVIARVNERMKRAWGIGAYWVATATSLLKYPLRPFELNLDGEACQGTFAVVGNARGYGGQLLITPQASLYENCLDICVFTGHRRSRYLSYLLGALSGRHLRYPDVIYRKVQHVEISADDSIPIQMDGEMVGYGSIKFSTFAEGLELVVP
ncbi:diacylglycerol kinase family lipid kinase [Acidobacteria bacterium AH-259-L09]|nr:diacylglycerol kinase family lipid kinase [Acidobacteria bacterium AH-259-L09]